MIIRGGRIKYISEDKEKIFAFKMDKRYGNDDFIIDIDIEKDKGFERLKIKLRPHENIEIVEFYLEGMFRYRSDSIVFSSGWLSSSLSLECTKNKRIKPLKWYGKRYFLRQANCTPFNFRGRIKSYTYTYIRKGEEVAFLGSLNEDFACTTFEHSIKDRNIRISYDIFGVKLEKELIISDILIFEGNEDEAFQRYFELSGKKTDKEKLSVFSYNIRNLKGNDLLTQMDLLSLYNLPFDIFLLEGFDDIEDFNNLKRETLNEIEALKLNAYDREIKIGAALSPFTTYKGSRIFEEHPTWVIKGMFKKPLPVGFDEENNRELYALDLNNSYYKEYLSKTFELIKRMGFDYLKLYNLYIPYLYAADEKTHLMEMNEALNFLKDISKGMEILAYDIPLASALRNANYMAANRAFVLNWKDDFLKRYNFREGASFYNSINNIILRHQLNGKVINNIGTCFPIDEKTIDLDKMQRHTILFTNSIFSGMIPFSGDLREINQGNIFEINSMFPFRDKKINFVEYIGYYKVGFTVEDREYIAYINLDEFEREGVLGEGVYYEGGNIVSGGNSFLLKPYESKCFHKIPEMNFALVGSMNHVIPLCEVDEFIVVNNEIELSLNRENKNRDIVYIKIPLYKEGFRVNGLYYEAKEISGLNIIEVDFLGI